MGSPQQPTYIIPPPSGPNWKTPALIGAFILLGAFNVFNYFQIGRLRSDDAAERQKLTADFNTAVERMRVDSSEQVQQSRRTVETLQTQLHQQELQAKSLVGAAKVDAEKKVQALQEKVAVEQRKQEEAITAVKSATDTNTTQIATVSTDVGTVKTDLGSTKSQLEQTIANLKKATGDIDSHSSLIATNANELAALKQLGERNYSEFTINKGKQFTRVGDVMIALKKADQKRHRFTIEITADDNTVEKKDRTINEPIQFLTSKARQPYEIVVNKVESNSITGYLAIPKVLTGRGGA